MTRNPDRWYSRGLRIAYGMGLVLAVLYANLIINQAAALGTLGYDYQAYDLAVDRLLAGRPLYDARVQAMGDFGLFFYPPPFVLLILPIALLPTETAIWTWTAILTIASVVAVVLLPVATKTRWIVLLLAALSWPLVYAIKLGQVGPLLLLLFAVGWRWLDRPGPFGLASGIGAVIKLQPALLIGWAFVTGRRRAAAIAIGVIAVLAVLGTLVAGPGAWAGWLDVLGRASRPILAENDMGFGRLAYLSGVPEGLAVLVHYANLALVLAVTALAVLRAAPVASFLAVVVASQFVSPVLWDHYALVLLLPVAWLLDRGHTWSVVIAAVTATPFVGITPPAAYPIVFWVALLAVTWEGIRARRGETLRAQGNPAPGGILAA